MENIFRNWLRACILNTKVLTPECLERALSRISVGCRFEVTDDWNIKVYDESNFVKSFQVTIENNIIKDVK